MLLKRRILVALAVVALIVIVVGVTFRPQARQRASPRQFFSSLDGLLPTSSDVPSEYRPLNYRDNSSRHDLFQAKGSPGYPGPSFGEKEGFLDGKAADGGQCGGFIERCRGVVFVLYRFNNSSMSKAFYDRSVDNGNLTYLNVGDRGYSETWEITGARIYYSDGDYSTGTTRRGLAIGVVSNVVLAISIDSEHTGFLGDDVKKDIVAFANLQLDRLL